MTKFLFASAILPTKSELVKHTCSRQSLLAPNLAHAMGIDHWQAWLQHTPGRDYFIQCVEASRSADFFMRLQEQIEERNPHAVWLRDFYLTTLGKDFSHYSATPSVQESLSMDLPLATPEGSTLSSQGYALPLLPDKLSAYFEFCRQATGECLYRFQEAYQRLGVSSISFFLQTTAVQNFLVIYQKSFPTPNQSWQFPACQWLFESLINLTGLSASSLKPSIEPLTAPEFSNLHR